MPVKYGRRKLFAVALSIAFAGWCSSASARVVVDNGALAGRACFSPVDWPYAAIPSGPDHVAGASLDPIEQLPSESNADLAVIRVKDNGPSRSAYLTSCAAFLACTLLIGLQRRRGTPVKMVLS